VCPTVALLRSVLRSCVGSLLLLGPRRVGDSSTRTMLDGVEQNVQPLREFVGFVWKDDQPRIDFKIRAKSLQDAKREILAQYGEGFAVSIWNEDDANRLR
jgi:hypothetical protein